MKIITINMPQKYLDAIQVLQDLEMYPSRSEFIRECLRNFLYEEKKFMNTLSKESFKMLIRRETN